MTNEKIFATGGINIANEICAQLHNVNFNEVHTLTSHPAFSFGNAELGKLALLADCMAKEHRAQNMMIIEDDEEAIGPADGETRPIDELYAAVGMGGDWISNGSRVYIACGNELLDCYTNQGLWYFPVSDKYGVVFS